MNINTKEKRNRKRKYKIHQFKIDDRKATLSLPLGYSDKVQLEFGKYYLVQDDFSLRWASKMQKQMRQYLYNRLMEMGLSDEYVLIMEFAQRPVVGKQSFCDFAVTFPNQFGEDFKMNQGFCRELIERFEGCFK